MIFKLTCHPVGRTFLNVFQLYGKTNRPRSAKPHARAPLIWLHLHAANMGSFRDDGSTASLIHKSTMTITEDDATTVHNDLRHTTSGLQMSRCGMLEQCDCSSISCHHRELYDLTQYRFRCSPSDTDSEKPDNCRLRRRPYTSPGLWHIIGPHTCPQYTSVLSSKVSAFFDSSRPPPLSQGESCPSSQRRNLIRRSLLR